MIKRSRLIWCIVLVLIAAISFFFVSDWAMSPDTYNDTMQSLTEMQESALGMTALATTVATGAAAVPGDATTPIANKIMDITGYMIIVYVAIVIEKYLLTLTGLLAFKYLIPVGCLIAFFAVLWRNEDRKQAFLNFAAKLALMGILLWALVPTSVIVSNLLGETYDSMENITAIQQELELEELKAEQGQIDTEIEGEGLSLKGIFGAVKEKASDIAETVDVKTDHFEESFYLMIEGVAVMIVRTCAIPICVLMLFVWIVKTVTGLAIAVPKVSSIPKFSKVVNGRKNTKNEIVDK